MRKLILLCLVILSFQVSAQDEIINNLKKEAAKEIKKDPNDSIPTAWKKGGMYNLNFSQGTLNNWAAGGDEFALAVNTILNLFAFYKQGKNSWDNSLDLNFGYIRSSSLGSRKNDDRIDLLTKYGRAVSSDWNVSALANFRSQMMKGYNYKDDDRTLTSAFLSPAYVLASIGMDYKPNDQFSVFISPATARWVIVKDDTLSAKGLYGVEPGKHSKTEIGAFITANYLKDISQNINYKGRLDLFSNYRHNPQNIDFFMSNLLSVKLWKVVSFNWNVDLIYDDDVRLFGENDNQPALQLKSLVGLGVMLKF